MEKKYFYLSQKEFMITHAYERIKYYDNIEDVSSYIEEYLKQTNLSSDEAAHHIVEGSYKKGHPRFQEHSLSIFGEEPDFSVEGFIAELLVYAASHRDTEFVTSLVIDHGVDINAIKLDDGDLVLTKFAEDGSWG